MKFASYLGLLAMSISTSFAASCSPAPATPAEQKVIFDKFVDAFYVKKNATEAFLNYVVESYIQHNPNFLSGRDVAMNGLKGALPTMNITIFKTSLSNDVGWIFWKEGGTKGYRAVVDIFRLNGTCVVEHWDVMQTKADSPKNPLAFFDGQI
jgi:predicted SnoaL-like aldol condensation-catalyzing enzyme